MASDYFIAHRIGHSGMEFHYSISQSQKPPVPFVRHRIGGSGSSRRARPLPFKAIDFWASYLSPPPSFPLPCSLEFIRGKQRDANCWTIWHISWQTEVRQVGQVKGSCSTLPAQLTEQTSYTQVNARCTSNAFSSWILPCTKRQFVKIVTNS